MNRDSNFNSIDSLNFRMKFFELCSPKFSWDKLIINEFFKLIELWTINTTNV